MCRLHPYLTYEPTENDHRPPADLDLDYYARKAKDQNKRPVPVRQLNNQLTYYKLNALPTIKIARYALSTALAYGGVIAFCALTCMNDYKKSIFRAQDKEKCGALCVKFQETPATCKPENENSPACIQVGEKSVDSLESALQPLVISVSPIQSTESITRKEERAEKKSAHKSLILASENVGQAKECFRNGGVPTLTSASVPPIIPAAAMSVPSVRRNVLSAVSRIGSSLEEKWDENSPLINPKSCLPNQVVSMLVLPELCI